MVSIAEAIGITTDDIDSAHEKLVGNRESLTLPEMVNWLKDNLETLSVKEAFVLGMYYEHVIKVR